VSWTIAGRTVLITGAARGIGLETARRLHARGMNVSMSGLEPELLEQRAAELGERAAWFQADVCDLDAVRGAVDATVERFGGLDVVVANAGIGASGTVRSMEPAAFVRQVDVNLLGVYRTLHAALPHVIERRGYLLPIASLSSAIHPPMMTAYAASKAGVEALTDGLRQEVAHTGTAVGCAFFSFLDTDMVQRGFERPSAQAMQERMSGLFARRSPLKAGIDAIERGIERRSRTVVAPRWARGVLVARTILQPLAERDAARRGIGDIVEMAEREATELTTEQPGSATRPVV
jgi:NAD(P)-dependent dehydrogenase (short-subunit alcohol dehydrogenase family)